jgi:starch phosphorylase
VEDLRHAHWYGDFELDPHLARVFKVIREGMFGDAGQFGALVNSIADHGDYYLVSDDFKSYIDTQKLIDEAYKNQDEWLTKSITAVARMGFFSSDRCIEEYAQEIWNTEYVTAFASCHLEVLVLTDS